MNAAPYACAVLSNCLKLSMPGNRNVRGAKLAGRGGADMENGDGFMLRGSIKACRNAGNVRRSGGTGMVGGMT